MFKHDGEYMPDVCDFWQHDRLPRSPLTKNVRSLRWIAPDTESNYHQQGNKEFGVDSVCYEFNSLGYRGSEFNRAPGEALVMFVGDSNTFGIGMPWAKLWTSIVTNHLQQQWSVDVRQCNLSWRGTGPDYTAMMIHQSIGVLRPDAVFVLWSYFNRMAWFPDSRRQVHFMAQTAPRDDVKEHSAYLRLATQSQGFFNYVRDFHLVDSRLRQCGIPYYWGNLEHLPAELLGHYLPLEGYVGDWVRIDSDFARDGQHAGPKAHASFAANVIDALERNSAGPGQRPAHWPKATAPAAHRPLPGPDITNAKRRSSLSRPVQTPLNEIKLRLRVRAMKKDDPFIY
jgi:hypothetical protein